MMDLFRFSGAFTEKCAYGRGCLYAVQLGVVGCAVLFGCTMTPQVRPASKSPREDTRNANESARSASDKSDGFVVPQAQAVGAEAPLTAGKEKTSQSAREFTVGLATMRWGENPPFAPPPAFHELDQEQARVSVAPPAIQPPSPWKLERTIEVGEGYLEKVQFTPDEKQVAVVSSDSGTMYHYGLESGQLVNKTALPHFERFESVDFTFLSETWERPQLLITRRSGAILMDHTSGVCNSLDVLAGDTLDPSGKFGLYGGTVREVTTQSGSLGLYWITGKPALTVQLKERPEDWALSGDGTWLAISFYPSNTTHVLDLQNRTLLHELENPKWGGSIALARDKSIIALGGEFLRVVRLSDGATLFEDHDYKNNIGDLAFTPNSDLLLVSAYDGKVRSYPLPSVLSSLNAAPRPQLLAHKYMSNVYNLGMSRDGRRLVSASGDRTLKVWKR